MANLYANENFPFPVVEALRTLAATTLTNFPNRWYCQKFYENSMNDRG
jgi:hypothetical protein